MILFRVPRGTPDFSDNALLPIPFSFIISLILSDSTFASCILPNELASLGRIVCKGFSNLLEEVLMPCDIDLAETYYLAFYPTNKGNLIFLSSSIIPHTGLLSTKIIPY
jgi:hypothetical protein